MVVISVYKIEKKIPKHPLHVNYIVNNIKNYCVYVTIWNNGYIIQSNILYLMFTNDHSFRISYLIMTSVLMFVFWFAFILYCIFIVYYLPIIFYKPYKFLFCCTCTVSNHILQNGEICKKINRTNILL